MTTGASEYRKDAAAKVTGRAQFTGDLGRPGMLWAAYLRSTIAHGRVTGIDTAAARALPGVAGVFTFRDVPEKKFATAGHPLSLDPARRDVADRRLLTGEVRFLGDEIAVVAAVDEATARAACRLIRVSYDPWPVLVDPADILAPGATRIHDETGNLAGEHCVGYGGDADAALAGADHVVTGTFETAAVQHCHLENHIAWASMDDLDRITIVTATQIPHIVRRIVAEALDMAESRIRVIKPFVGGGFGNKQDVILEPMVAFLTLKLSGRPVGMGLTREEGMTGTRTRHRFCMTVTTGVMNDGTLTARKMDAVSVTGAYASHGHAVAAAGGGANGALYPRVAARYRARTVYATLPAAGAMRAYGSPQVMFALECAVEDAARAVGMDSVAFRLRNIARQGDVDPQSGSRFNPAAWTGAWPGERR
jgi:xanthine dehydrogenase molybdenum-binding subunit